MKLNLELAQHALALRTNTHFIAFVEALAENADQDNVALLHAREVADVFHYQGRVAAAKDILDTLADAQAFVQKYEERN